MAHFNMQILIGNTGTDVELRETRSGKKMGTVTLATDDEYYDKESNEWQSRVNWHRIVIYNERLAGKLATNAPKGSQLLVQGTLSTSSYTDDKGIVRRTFETIADKVLILREVEHV